MPEALPVILDELSTKGGWFALAGAALGTGGVWRWLSARETARPATIEQAVAMMKAANDEIRAEIKRMDDRERERVAEMRAERDRRHEIANRLAATEAWAFKLRDVLQEALDIIATAGHRQPRAPRNMTIDQLMAGPVAAYQPGAATRPRPVTDKDEA